MILSKETWEMIVEGLQTVIQDQARLLEEQSDQYDAFQLKTQLDKDDYAKSTQMIKDALIEKCNEITNLKLKLREYENKEKVEDFIKGMGRRYTDPKANLSWERLFYILYPSADEFEYHKKGKAKEAIKGLLRSHDLGFDNNGTIFRQH
jgi:hypothetical protein